MEENKIVKMGLCANRHVIPGVDTYIYDVISFNGFTKELIEQLETDAYYVLNKLEPGSTIDLYVTGFTLALIAVINVVKTLNLNLIVRHYDKTTGEYIPQKVKI